jgi:hypothetical protein
MDAIQLDNMMAIGVMLVVPVVVLAVMFWRSARLAVILLRSTRADARR